MDSRVVKSRLEALHEAGIDYEQISAHYYRVEPAFSYWPSTDRWRAISGHVSGYGVKNLIKAAESQRS